ncbi:transcriptional regulator [Shewanella psychropiezotolerans]|uniref:Transcriptional regulator n=1 Tax=Shewanella psychropiezotolerans TaxID=2593655 RepID=A0ABX5WY56_9GAMM|nr:helix-turn-helix domain-containing protein [Shewanella psychropiezotolerans]QDO84040.1 transcriptional regulator [Shewanella psychropiezotolerans]
MKPVDSNCTESRAAADMPRLDIVYLLHKKGLSLRRVGQEAGLGPGTLSKALDRPWTKGERLIAEALEMKPQDIWPTRYESIRYENRPVSLHGKLRVN